MKMLFNVDQTEALRRGIDASNSTIQLDIDPSELTQIERDVLAAIMVNGHDCTQYRLDAALSDDDTHIEGRRDWSTVQSKWKDATDRLNLIELNIDGLRAAIAGLLGQRELYLKTQRRERDEKCIAIENKLVEELNHPSETVWCWKDGISSIGREISVVIEDYPYLPELGWGNSQYLCEDSLKKYETARERVKQLRSELEAAARIKLEKIREERLAEESERQAEANQEYAELFDRLPETFRARIDAGFAFENEIETALIELMKKDAGYGDILTTGPFDHIVESDGLSDEQFLRLKEIEKAAPKDADVEAVDVWNNDDDDDDPDAGNPKYARISWSKGGVTAVVFISLD